MTRTDHAAQATSALDGGRLHLAWAADAPTAPETNAHLQAAQAVFMAAQAEATLALAEQQRIANLIALATATHPMLSEQVATDAAHALTEFNEHSMGGYHQASPDVAAALGIAGHDDPEFVAPETS